MSTTPSNLKQPFGITNLAQLERFRKWAAIHPELGLDPQAPIPEHMREGCRKMTHVAGTNGGLLPCGSVLVMGEVTGRYYCAECTKKGLVSPHD